MPARSTDGVADPATIKEPPPAADAASDYRLDDQIGHLLRRVSQQASANLATRLADHGLTTAQYVVLARLAETGAASQNQLGRLVAMEPANIHGIVGRLGERGLVTTAPDPTDRRRLLVSLTGLGTRLIHQVRPIAADASAATLAPLAEAERKTLIALLRRLLTE